MRVGHSDSSLRGEPDQAIGASFLTMHSQNGLIAGAFFDHAEDQGHLVWRVLMLTLSIRSLAVSKPTIQIGDNHASKSPTTLNDSHAHNSHCRWPARPILVCDRLRHGAAADAPAVGISSSQPLIEVSSDTTSGPQGSG